MLRLGREITGIDTLFVVYARQMTSLQAVETDSAKAPAEYVSL